MEKVTKICKYCNNEVDEDLFKTTKGKGKMIGERVISSKCNQCESDYQNERQKKKRAEDKKNNVIKFDKDRVIPKYKECKTCKETKETEFFFNKRGDSFDGLRGECKACGAIKNKKAVLKQNEMRKAKRKEGNSLTFIETARRYTRKSITSKCRTKLKYIGCNLERFKSWLESQFDSNMNWDNYGTYWDVDHVIPVDMFDMSNSEERDMSFNWKNTQPLSKDDNSSKANKVVGHYITNNFDLVEEFTTKYNMDEENRLGQERVQWFKDNIHKATNLSKDASTVNLLEWVKA